MKRVISTGRSVDDAVTSALVQLGVTRANANVRVIQEPVKGLFGLIGGKDAEVEVSVTMTAEEVAREFLLGTLRRMDMDARVKSKGPVADFEMAIVLELICNDDMLPVVIGRHGATLDSLQYLVNVVANQEEKGKYTKFIVDAGGYRKRHRESIERIAERARERALRIRKPVTLESMSAADRKTVHMYLQECEDVSTSSEGTDPNRRVVVTPVPQSGSLRALHERVE